MGGGLAAVLGPAAFLCALGALCAPASAQMFLPGTFEVSDTGAAVYTIPIEVPPGTVGMQPSLSLQYNSQGGNGLLGMGWTLAGLPSITRCPRTLAQDGAVGGINFDSNDRFCLEGERLIAINGGTYGADGTEYRTERDGFSRIISHGSAGAGPAWFEVHAKAGQIMQFGNTPDSEVLAQGKATARLWAVNRVSDTKGNYFTVTYTQDSTNGQYYPSRVDYTGNSNSGIAPYASVQFVYAARPDITPLYQAGSLSQITQLLTHVQSYAGGALVRDYQLAYNVSTSTQRSRLSSIVACDASGNCLPATSLAYQERDAGTLNWPSTFCYGCVSYSNSNQTIGSLIADFNGDGKQDVLRWGADPSANPNQVWLSNGDGSFTLASTPNLISTPLMEPANGYGIVVGDFNGDGKADILRWANDPSQNALFISNGDGTFSQIPTNLIGQQLQHSNGTVGILVGDFNGDGKADIVRWWNNPAYNAVFLSNGDGNFAQISTNLVGQQLQDSNGTVGIVLGDFNGDGKIDILRWWDTTAANALFLSNGDGNFTPAASFNLTSTTLVASDNSAGFLLGDFNGDGKTDILRYEDNPANNELYLSDGDGSFSVPGAFQAGQVLWAHSNGTVGSLIGDFNGDGKTDILRWTNDPSGNELWLSAGDGSFFQPPDFIAGQVSWSNSNGTLGSLVGDYTGDGKSDVIRWDNNPAYNELWVPEAGISDLLVSASPGVGETTSVASEALAQSGASYTKDVGSLACAYPCLDIQTSLYVTSQVSTSNGIGSPYISNYSYAGAKSDQSGRGFLGFRQLTATDAQTGIATTTNYQQLFPYTGMVASRTKALGAQTLNSTINTYGCVLESTGSTSCPPSDPGSVYTVTLQQSVEQSWDLNGAALPSVTTSNQYDSYGNATQVGVSTSDGYTKTTNNTYTNDTANWFLGRLTGSSVTSTTP